MLQKDAGNCFFGVRYLASTMQGMHHGIGARRKAGVRVISSKQAAEEAQKIKAEGDMEP